MTFDDISEAGSTWNTCVTELESDIALNMLLSLDSLCSRRHDIGHVYPEMKSEQDVLFWMRYAVPSCSN